MSSIKSVFVAGSVGRFVSIVTKTGCRLPSGIYFISAYVSERGCRGNTVLSFRSLLGEVVAMGWREACDGTMLSASIVSDLRQIEKFFVRPSLLASVEIGEELELPALNFDTEITVEDVLALN